MNDETLSGQLKAVPMPADLAPPGDFTDGALRRAARSRGRRTITAVVVVVAVLAGATAVMGGGTGVPPADPAPSGSSSTLPDEAVPHPGGGPRVVDAFSFGSHHYLLDLRSGEYRGVPVRAETSPDGRFVALSDIDRGTGTAEREAYLDDGEAAVTWLSGPEVTDTVGGIGELWSPDGTKVLGGTEVDTGDGGMRLGSLTSFDRTTGQPTVTTVPPDLVVTSVVWAPDSAGYAISVLREDGTGELRNLSLDGVVGQARELAGDEAGLVGYSPDGRHLLYRYSRWDTETETGETRVVVLDATTGDMTLDLTYEQGDGHSAAPLLWTDADTFLVAVERYDLQRTEVEVVDVDAGESVRTIPWPGAETLSVWSVGSSAGLPPEAADLGF